ncbi:MAG: AI-2E family transporter [Anaerolineales bacterium]|nr:AI-2E family transporter [Anaerolineales bacterium]
MSTEWSRPTKYIVGVGLFLFSLYILYLSQDTLTLLVVAALIAFLLTPLINFFHQRLKIPRGLAVLLSYLLLILFFYLSPLILLPPIIDGFQIIASVDYQILVDQIHNWLIQTLVSLQASDLPVFGMPIDLSGFVDPALEMLQASDSAPLTLPSLQAIIEPLRSAATITYGLATSVAGTLVSGALSVVFTLFFALYMSLDSYKFRPWFLRVFPKPIGQKLPICLNGCAISGRLISAGAYSHDYHRDNYLGWEYGPGDAGSVCPGLYRRGDGVNSQPGTLSGCRTGCNRGSDSRLDISGHQ